MAQESATRFDICKKDLGKCVTSVHNGHSIRDITEVAATAREDVQKRLGNIKEDIETLSEKSLAKEFELIDAINFPEEPKEIKPFNRNRFVNSVIDKIKCKYGERNPTPGSSPCRSKSPSVSTSHFSRYYNII
ncbi:hypothetical protein AM593_10041, partial [Mytilus galloprovincialis]